MRFVNNTRVNRIRNNEDRQKQKKNVREEQQKEVRINVEGDG